MGVIVGVAYATYLLLEDLVKPGADNDFIKVMSLSAYVTMVMTVVPTIFKWVANLAGGATRIRMYQTLLQTVLLAITLTSVIIFRYSENKVYIFFIRPVDRFREPDLVGLRKKVY